MEEDLDDEHSDDQALRASMLVRASSTTSVTMMTRATLS
jgi:hypothetical protein